MKEPTPNRPPFYETESRDVILVEFSDADGPAGPLPSPEEFIRTFTTARLRAYLDSGLLGPQAVERVREELARRGEQLPPATS